MREEVQACRNQIAQLNALIAEMEVFDDPGEVFDTLMGLRDDVRVENAKLMGPDELVAQAEEDIEMKEGQLEVADGLMFGAWYEWLIIVFGACVLRIWMRMLPLGVWQSWYYAIVDLMCDIENGDRLKVLNCSYLYVSCGAKYCIIPAHLVPQPYLVYMGPFFILDKLYEVAESPRLVDKMKYVFCRSRGEDELFAGLMRGLCLSLRISLSKKRRLIAELEAVEEGSWKHCGKRLAQVGVSFKSGFVVDMEVKD
ncbi:hypothetical protein Tco_0464439 [Tanacetum coccineum]